MNVNIPELSLVVLIGAAGSGRSSFVRKFFRDEEIISFDFPGETFGPVDFEALCLLVGQRLVAGDLTVVDVGDLRKGDRQHLVALARKYHCRPVVMVFSGPDMVVPDLRQDGFRQVHVFPNDAEAASAVLVRTPILSNRQYDHGPFDMIGDVHGCYDELVELLRVLGYEVDEARFTARSPAGRKAVFLGDLVDRGPGVVPVLKLAMNMVEAGDALCVPGNHDARLHRKLTGHDVPLKYGLLQSLAELELEPPEFSNRVAEFIGSLPSHYVLDDGELVVAHAGMKLAMQGRRSGAVLSFAHYGETNGERDEYGFPVRLNWAADYYGRAHVVYGHTPIGEPVWLNRTINIDTGCVFGGRLTALRYPEKELVSVPARFTYFKVDKPFMDEAKRAPLYPGAQSSASQST